MAKKKNELNLLQKKFINFWFETGGNATQAARLAGYQGTYNSIAWSGKSNLNHPAVKAEIVERLEKEAITANEVLWRLGEIGRMDISPYIEEEGRFYHVNLEKLLADGNGHWIKSIKHTRNGDIIEFYNKQRALEQLLKYFKVDAPHLQINADNRTLVLDFGDFRDDDKEGTIRNQITQDSETGSA